MNEITGNHDASGERPADRGPRLALAAGPRGWIVVTLLLGVSAGPLVALTTPLEQRTFSLLSGPVQLLMSITVPFVGVLLVSDARRAGPAARAGAVRAALTSAVGVALFGLAICAATVAWVGSTAPGGPWRHAAAAAAGGVAVQVVDQLLGIGFALVTERPVLACLATFSPLAVWALLGLVEAVRPARAWLTPAATAQALLAGESPAAWVQEIVVVLVWGLGFWLAGATRTWTSCSRASTTVTRTR